MAGKGGIGFFVVHHAPPCLLRVGWFAFDGPKRDLYPCEHDAAVLDGEDARVMQWLQAIFLRVLQAK